MAKRHFLQKAHTFNLDKHTLAGRFMSEKLDGIRFFWDGGATRGLPIENVPWSNIAKSNSIPKSTGLWSNYAKPFNAPDWWLDELPVGFPLEGELFTGRGEFQRVSSIVRSSVNQKDWSPVKAVVFDTPDMTKLLSDGEINETHYKKLYSSFLIKYREFGGKIPHNDTAFRQRLGYLKRHLPTNAVVLLHDQIILPFSTPKATDELNRFTDSILEKGGEGAIIRAPNDLWLPQRCHSLLKVKPFCDAEAIIVGYTWGEETDKGSKLQGLMGALICKIDAGEFKLSGFTDQERTLVDLHGDDAAPCWEPGKVVTPNIHNPQFPRFNTVTYKYRELTDDGLPKEARYFRNANV